MSTPNGAQDLGAAVSATTWVFAIFTITIVPVQVAFKHARHKSLELGDYLLIVAAVIALGQSVAVTEQVVNGLGQSVASISNDKFVNFEKALYSSQMLYVGALGSAKTAAAYMASRISMTRLWINIGRILLVISALWTAVGMVSAALQCGPLNMSWQIFSDPDSGICFDRAAFWNALGVIDIILDLAIAALASHLIWSVDLPRPSKLRMTVAFCLRLVAAPFLVTRLVLIHNIGIMNDPTRTMVTPAIITQAQMTLSIITTCAPYLSLYIQKFYMGLFTTNMRIAPGRKNSKPINLAPIKTRAPDRRYLDPTTDPARHYSVRGSIAPSLGSASIVSSKMCVNKTTSFWVEEERASAFGSPRLRGSPREPHEPSRPPVPTIKESFLEDP